MESQHTPTSLTTSSAGTNGSNGWPEWRSFTPNLHTTCPMSTCDMFPLLPPPPWKLCVMFVPKNFTCTIYHCVILSPAMQELQWYGGVCVFRSGTRVLQRCSGVVQGCYRGVQGWYRGVTRVFTGCYSMAVWSPHSSPPQQEVHHMRVVLCARKPDSCGTTHKTNCLCDGLWHDSVNKTTFWVSALRLAYMRGKN